MMIDPRLKDLLSLLYFDEALKDFREAVTIKVQDAGFGEEGLTGPAKEWAVAYVGGIDESQLALRREVGLRRVNLLRDRDL